MLLIYQRILYSETSLANLEGIYILPKSGFGFKAGK